MVSKASNTVDFKGLQAIMTKDPAATKRAIAAVNTGGRTVLYYSVPTINAILGELSANVSFKPSSNSEKSKASDMVLSIFSNNTTPAPSTTAQHPATDNFLQKAFDWAKGTSNVLKNPYSPMPGPQTKFNLPPHKINRLNNTNRTVVSPGSRAFSKAHPTEMGMDPGLDTEASTPFQFPRRGMIWWDASTKLQTSNEPTDAAAEAEAEKRDGSIGSFYGVAAEANLQKNHDYGFSFMFNPTSFNITTGVDMDRVPTTGDSFLGNAGDDYQGAQELQFTLFIDRSTDFAYLNARARDLSKHVHRLTESDCVPLAKWYADDPVDKQTYVINPGNIPAKISELAARGTMHDIDYLYSVVNGRSWLRWKTGKPTGDIGFLYYTLVNLSLGAHTYSGVIRSINVEHSKFLENMIPIQSTVSMSIQLRATASSTISTPTTTGAP